MEKRVLILVLSCDIFPYSKMLETSQRTWDSVEVEGVESVFYCGKSNKKDTDKIIYLSVNESYYSMGEKMMKAFQWALDNKEFDYILRVNSSCYVDKKQLIKYIQSLPNEDVFAGALVVDTPQWQWGGAQFVFSKDIVQKLVASRNMLRHDIMEDKAISYLANDLKIHFTQIKGSCSLNKQDNGWLCISTENDNFIFSNFEDVKTRTNHCYRVKVDGDRSVDEYLMNELFKCLV